MQKASDFDFFCGVLLYNWQVFQLGNSVVCKISRKNVNCYYKKYFLWLKPYILFPNLAPALINEHSDGDSLGGERASVLCNRLPFTNGIRRPLNDVTLKS